MQSFDGRGLRPNNEERLSTIALGDVSEDYRRDGTNSSQAWLKYSRGTPNEAVKALQEHLLSEQSVMGIASVPVPTIWKEISPEQTGISRSRYCESLRGFQLIEDPQIVALTGRTLFC
jgi:hypothetical protein